MKSGHVLVCQAVYERCMKCLWAALAVIVASGCGQPTLKVEPGAPRYWDPQTKSATDRYAPAAKAAPETPDQDPSIFHRDKGYKRFMSEEPSQTPTPPAGSTYRPSEPIGGESRIGGAAPYTDSKPWAGDYGGEKAPPYQPLNRPFGG